MAVGWIFASVVLILLVVSPGFRKTAGGLVAAVVLLGVIGQVHYHYEKKAEAEAAQREAAHQKPDLCDGIENSGAHLECLLSDEANQ